MKRHERLLTPSVPGSQARTFVDRPPRLRSTEAVPMSGFKGGC